MDIRAKAIAVISLIIFINLKSTAAGFDVTTSEQLTEAINNANMHPGPLPYDINILNSITATSVSPITRAILMTGVGNPTITFNDTQNFRFNGAISINNTLNNMILTRPEPAAPNRSSVVYNNGTTLNINSVEFNTNQMTPMSANLGGAIYNTGIANINSSKFNGNRAYEGGAIYNTAAGRLNFTGENTFSGNIADVALGGAVNTSGTTSFVGTNHFTSNKAVNGGAIGSIQTTVTMSGINNFTQNEATSGSGGAINARGGIFNMLGESNFTANQAIGNSGGAIATAFGTTMTISGASNFIQNTAPSGNGGAIVNVGRITIGGTSKFEENSARFGGAIFNENGGIFNLSGTSTFKNNSAVSGSGSLGGAIYTGYNAQFNITGDEDTVIFQGNSVPNGNGGAIFNRLTALNISSITHFTSNSARLGGAIYNDIAGATTTISNESYFDGNTATQHGGAVYNNAGTIFSVSGISEFTNNRAGTTSPSVAGSGGAIYNLGTVNIGSTAEFSGNTATQNGGAIYSQNATASVNITTSGGNIDFTNNSALNGGAIANSSGSSVNISASNGDVNFSGNRASGTTGGAIFTQNSTTTLTSSADGDINFTNNTTSGTTTLNDINLSAGTLQINGEDGEVNIGSGISGTGTINKSNAGVLNLIGTGSTPALNTFTGTFNQTTADSKTVVSNANLFNTANNNIQAGILELADNSTLSSSTRINLADGADLNITTSTTLSPRLTFGNLAMNGFGGTYGDINKTGTGTLDITGNNSAFLGTFYQTAGETIVTSAGRLFGGDNTIETSLLDVTADSLYYKVILADEGILNHYSTDVDGGTIEEGTVLSFTGEDAIATFGKDPDVSGNVKYLLGTPINSLQTNTVAFNNADVGLGEFEYLTSTIYKFSNSTIDLTADPDLGTDIGDYLFNNLEIANTKLSFHIKFNGGGIDPVVMNSDTLTANNLISPNNIGIAAIQVLNDNVDNGLSGSYTSDVLFGLQFDPAATIGALSTTVYEYAVSIVDGTGGPNTAIELTAVAPASEYSLNAMNIYMGNRGFNFSYFLDESLVYYNAASLDPMAEGNFVVQGYNETNPTQSIISGILFGSTTKGYLFNIDAGTDVNFTLKNLTVQDALAAQGSVLRNESANAEVLIDNVIVKNNTATQEGGAIYNNAGNLTVNNVEFNGNNAGTSGGAIYNNGTITIADSTSFTNNTAGTSGGAIYNTGTLNIGNNNVFDSNTATNESGGAIYSTSALTIGNDNTFTSNGAFNNGGVINAASSLAIGNSNTFTENVAVHDGGVIYSTSNLTIGNGNTFTKNLVGANGGVIYSTNDLTIADGNTFTENSSGLDGGAINAASSLTIGNNNTFTGNSAGVSGGAIQSTGPLIIGSGVVFDGNQAANSGGAIAIVSGNSTLENVTFTGNSAARGGALASLGGSTTILNSLFFNNSATTSGGAIYIDNSSVNLIADGANNTVFSGNTSGDGTAIYLNSNATLNLNVAPGSVIVLDDKIGSPDINNQININKPGTGINTDPPVGAPTGGAINLNNAIDPATINFYNGIINLADDSYLNGNDFNMYGGTLNAINGMVGTLALNNVTFNGSGNFLIDVDLINAVGDQITAASAAGLGTLTISQVNLLTEDPRTSTDVIVADANVRGFLNTSITEARGDLYEYQVSYDGATGILNFLRGSIAPPLNSGSVAQNQIFMLQSAINREFMGNMDSFMAFPLTRREDYICCVLNRGILTNAQNCRRYRLSAFGVPEDIAALPNQATGLTGAAAPAWGNGVFSPVYGCGLNRGVWVRPFVSFQDVPLQNGPNVKAVDYGSVIGYDTIMRPLKYDFVGNNTFYVGYIGGTQRFSDVDVRQNGGFIGIAENMVRGNTFITAMANVGDLPGEAHSPRGTDTFNTLFAGAAIKAAHNLEFKNGEYIIQPSIMAAYVFARTFDYTTQGGVDVTSKPFNAIQAIPGVRLIKNMNEGNDQIYLVCNFVYNIMNKTRFEANGIGLPQMWVAPYVEYGFGYQKTWAERFTAFGQALVRGGGINGIGIQLGFRVAI